MVEAWLVLSLITLVMWGIWGFLGKLALKSLDWKEVWLVAGISSTIVFIITALILRPPINLKINMGNIYAILIGLTILGGVTFYMALSKGKASIVIPLTALYPAFAVVLSFFILHEKITLFQGLGILLAIGSIILLSLS